MERSFPRLFVKQRENSNALELQLAALAAPLARRAGYRGRIIAVHVSFVPNAVLRRLKKRMLKKDTRFVNVLAFREPSGLPHPGVRGRFLGDIYLNEVYRKSNRRDERTEMFIHGLLHLLGFSHKRIRDTIEMERLEKRLFAGVYEKRGKLSVR